MACSFMNWAGKVKSAYQNYADFFASPWRAVVLSAASRLASPILIGALSYFLHSAETEQYFSCK